MVVGSYSEKIDTLVIGAGPGGYVAAIRAAQEGKKVVIVEKEFVGGVCLNVGCIPSKAMISVAREWAHTTGRTPYGIDYSEVSFDFKKLQKWKERSVVKKLTKGVEYLLKKNDVEIVEGVANFISDHQVRVAYSESDGITYEFENAIIATGSTPIQIPGFEWSEDILDSTGLLNLAEQPDSLAIIGGGYIGMELAMVYAQLGTEVTVIESLDRVLSGFEKDLVKPVAKAAKKAGVKMITNATAKSYEATDDGLTLTYEVDGDAETVAVDKIAVLVGRKPNTSDKLAVDFAGIETTDRGHIKVNKTLQTNKSHIYAIGDVIEGPALAHKAMYEGKIAAEHLAGHTGVAADNLCIPTVCYTSPEIATVGLTANEAKEQDIEVKIAEFNYGANGRSLAMDNNTGFVRLVSDKETDRLIGAQIVGPEASELIAECTVAIENLLTAEDLSLTIHAHPSLAEMVLDAAEKLIDKPIHQ